MTDKKPYLLLALAGVMLVSCTNSRWIVTDRQAVDRENATVTDSREILQQQREVSRENPVLTLQTMTVRQIEYSERIQMQRYVQDYKMNWVMASIGIAGAATAFWAANSSLISINNKRLKSWALNSTGGVLVLASALSVVPDGEPRPTGEERLLRDTGTQTVYDTTQTVMPDSSVARLTITYRDSILVDREQPATNGTIQVNLGARLDELAIKGLHPGDVDLELSYHDSLYRYRFPVSSVLQPYAVVAEPVTELRSSPNLDEDNVLTDLVMDSRLPIDSFDNDRWFRVLYGISESYILSEDAGIAWNTSGSLDQDQVVAIPDVPFGEVDVESNIPILRRSNPDGMALIITMEDYGTRYERRPYANRDGKLIKRYLKNALGYPEQQLYRLPELSDTTLVYSVLDAIRRAATPQTNLVVYLSGYAEAEDADRGGTIYQLSSASSDTLIRKLNLHHLYRKIAEIETEKTLVINELDFVNREYINPVEINNLFRDSYLQDLAQLVTNRGGVGQSAVFFGSAIDQQAGLFMGSPEPDNRHRIFTYHLAEAIQQRNTRLNAIIDHLERNVSFTSRKLYDRAQDFRIFGDRTLDLSN